MQNSRVILLTGASAGLGAAIARRLAREGHRLALVARRADRLEALAMEIRNLGGRALVLPVDLADPEAASTVIASTVEHFGRLDVLINNAAYGLPEYFGQSSPEAIRSQIEVNLNAPMLLTRHALPHLFDSKGTVINMGSAIVRVANPIFGAYGTTKAALNYWTDALRREVRHRGVSVCFVELGPIETDFFDAVGRLEGGESAIGIGPPPDSLYNALRDRPPRLAMIRPESAASRIASLIQRPRPRIAVPRRVVWPMRLLGSFLGIFPKLADLAISAMIQRVERERMPQSPQITDSTNSKTSHAGDSLTNRS